MRMYVCSPSGKHIWHIVDVFTESQETVTALCNIYDRYRRHDCFEVPPPSANAKLCKKCVAIDKKQHQPKFRRT